MRLRANLSHGSRPDVRDNFIRYHNRKRRRNKLIAKLLAKPGLGYTALPDPRLGRRKSNSECRTSEHVSFSRNSVSCRRGKNALVRNIAFLIFGLVVLLASAGATYQLIANRADARRFPEPGRLVEVGGFRLKLNCTGIGSPTVVLESGFGDV